MGFFTKKDADGLPSSFQDLGKELQPQVMLKEMRGFVAEDII